MTLSERSRANVPLAAGAVAIVAIIGWTVGFVVYVDRRFSALEVAKETTAKEIAAIQAERLNDSRKMDALLISVNEIRVGVARIDERTQKP